jgi:hypothetical protein
MTNDAAGEGPLLSRCCQCGGSDTVDKRFVACAAISEWAKVGSGLAYTRTDITSRDDIKPWQIFLCEICIPRSYQVYLRERLTKLRLALSIALFTLIFGVIAVVVGVQLNLFRIPFHVTGVAERVVTGPANAQAGLAVVVVVLALIGGAISVPVYIIMAVLNQRRLSALRLSGVVPESAVDKSFIGEAQRILAILAPAGTSISDGVWGDFPLPQHKAFDQLVNPPEQESKVLRKREIVAVGLTIQALEGALPNVWKETWQKRYRAT